MLDSARGVNGIRRLVVRIDQRAIASARNAAGIAGSHAWTGKRSVEGLKCGDPSILRKIVEEQTESRAHNGAARLPERIGDAEPWRELLAVIVRRADRQR